MEIQVNDIVLFTAYAGANIKHEGEEYLIMHEEDVLAVLAK